MRHGSKIEVSAAGPGKWSADDTSVWLWFEKQQLKIANLICSEAQEAVRAKQDERARKRPRFSALDAFEAKPRAPTFTISDAQDILKYVGTVQHGGDISYFTYHAAGGTKEFSTQYTKRPGTKKKSDPATSEIYVNTKPSKYAEMAVAVEGGTYTDPKKANATPKTYGGVDGGPEGQARSVRRLVKGRPTEENGDLVVPDDVLQVVASIWGVAEAARSPNNLGNLFVTLHLLKKELITWSDAVDSTHRLRWVPSGKGAAKQLQLLLASLVEKADDANYAIPVDLQQFAKPFKEGLATFVASASEKLAGQTYPDYVLLRNHTFTKITYGAGKLTVESSSADEARMILASIIYKKILAHLGGARF